MIKDVLGVRWGFVGAEVRLLVKFCSKSHFDFGAKPLQARAGVAWRARTGYNHLCRV